MFLGGGLMECIENDAWLVDMGNIQKEKLKSRQKDQRSWYILVEWNLHGFDTKHILTVIGWVKFPKKRMNSVLAEDQNQVVGHLIQHSLVLFGD